MVERDGVVSLSIKQESLCGVLRCWTMRANYWLTTIDSLFHEKNATHFISRCDVGTCNISILFHHTRQRYMHIHGIEWLPNANDDDNNNFGSPNFFFIFSFSHHIRWAVWNTWLSINFSLTCLSLLLLLFGLYLSLPLLLSFSPSFGIPCVLPVPFPVWSCCRHSAECIFGSNAFNFGYAPKII